MASTEPCHSSASVKILPVLGRPASNAVAKKSNGPLGERDGDGDGLFVDPSERQTVHLLVNALGRRHGGTSSPDSRNESSMCDEMKCTISEICLKLPTKHSGRASTRRAYDSVARPTTK